MSGDRNPYRRHFSFRPIHNEMDQRLADEYHGLRLKLARERLLPLASTGERWATLRLLEICSDAILDSARFSGDIAKWFSEGVLHIARGDSVEEAFNMPKRGKGIGREGGVALELARQSLWAYRVAYRTMVNHEKQLYAFRKVAEESHVDMETVKAAWRAHKEVALREIDLQQKLLGKVTSI